MMRSMYSGVAGLKVHQTKMDVIGNNIANVNTAGFKASSVVFNDVFYQTTSKTSAANEIAGTTGINAKQIGMGASVASIAKNITESGGSQTTNDPFNVMINGDGFFIVNTGGTNYFTKNGAFMVDANGTLCTATGAMVMGWQVDPDDTTKCRSDVVSALKIMSPENMSAEPEATTNTYLTGNIDKKDTQIAYGSSGKNFQVNFYDTLGFAYTAQFAMLQTSGRDDVYTVYLQDIVDSNTNKSVFVEENPEQANSYLATGLQFFTSLEVPEEAVDSGEEATVSESDGSVTLGEEGGLGYAVCNVAFDNSSGKFISLREADVEGGEDPSELSNPEEWKTSLNFQVVSPAYSSFGLISIDFSNLTMYAGSGTSSVESTMGDVDGNGKGKMAGEMSGVNIDSSGKIYGTYTNGDLKLLGQLVVAKFANASGLEAMGNSLFAETLNSGRFNGIGEDPTSGGDSLSAGVLEMSNVDLAAQFTDMITTQRGFQANSRIITTSDTLLEELVNLKR